MSNWIFFLSYIDLLYNTMNNKSWKLDKYIKINRIIWKISEVCKYKTLW